MRQGAEARAGRDPVERVGELLQRLAGEGAVVDERVGRVGLADGRVATEGGGVDRHVGDRIEVLERQEVVVARHRRAGEHERGQLGVLRLDEARRDHPAERVADAGRPGAPGARRGRGRRPCARSATIASMSSTTARLARRAAVPVVVGRVDDGAVGGQPGGDVRVAAAVLAVAVDEQGDEARLALRIPPANDDRAALAGKLEVALVHGHAAIVRQRAVGSARGGLALRGRAAADRAGGDHGQPRPVADAWTTSGASSPTRAGSGSGCSTWP